MSRVAVSTVLFLVACGSGGGFPDAKNKEIDAPTPGKFKVAWTLVDMADNPISCADVSAITVDATLRSPQVAGGTGTSFACNAGTSMSDDILPGSWNIAWELTGGSLGTLATAPRTEDVEIKSGQTTDIGTIKFVVDTTGALNLHVTANRPGGNCGTVANMGAGITGTTITLVHQGGACEAATLDIAAGATQPAQQYMIDCNSPVVVNCIENDQAITATGLPAGPYQIHIRGNQGATSCWLNDDGFSIPAAGKTLTRTLNLGFATGTAGCTQ